MVSRARALGIDPSTMTPDVLGAVLGAVEANQATAARQAPPAAPVAPAPEPALDWGEDDQGNPITSEEQAKKLYPRALFNAIKASHQVPVLAKQNAELQQTIERDRQERQAVAFDRKLTKHLATTRPDLFGADVDPNLVAQRKAAVEDHIGRLFAAKTQTTLQNDVAAALTIYGPGPAAQPAAGTMPGAKGPSPVEIAAGYRQAELARATGRRETLVMTREQRMLAEEVARQQERNNGSVLVAGEDDNSDLPDAPKG